ncbi:MAG: hypothetical protein ACHP65_08060 [Legionellales bacterium]
MRAQQDHYDLDQAPALELPLFRPSTQGIWLLDSIPKDLCDKILYEFLTPDDGYSLKRTSLALYQLYQTPMLLNLLDDVAWGDFMRPKQLNAVASLTPQHLSYFVARGTIQDRAGRQFFNISAFQYALWALDGQALQMIVDSLRNAAGQGGPSQAATETIRIELLAQYQEVITQGLSYTANHLTVTENHFDFGPWINMLKGHASCGGPERKHYLNLFCQQLVNLPVHVIQEYYRLSKERYYFLGLHGHDKSKAACEYRVTRFENNAIARVRKNMLVRNLISDKHDCDLMDLKHDSSFPPILSEYGYADWEAMVVLHATRLCDVANLKFTLTHPNFQSPERLSTLLFHTARGEEVQAKAFLQKSPAHLGCLIERGNVHDYSGRVFFNISAFQYAVWAKDWHMWRMMLGCLHDAAHSPLNNAAAAALQLTLLAQFNEVVTQGIRYHKYDQWILESHFNFQPLLDALKNFIDLADGTEAQNFRSKWCHDIRFIQHELPAHAAQEYCRKEFAFWKNPLFGEGTLTRKLILQGMYSRTHYWWTSVQGDPADLERGDNWVRPMSYREYGAVSKGIILSGYDALDQKDWIGTDWKAMSILSKVRTRDVEALRVLLSMHPLPTAEKTQATAVCSAAQAEDKPLNVLLVMDSVDESCSAEGGPAAAAPAAAPHEAGVAGSGLEIIAPIAIDPMPALPNPATFFSRSSPLSHTSSNPSPSSEGLDLNSCIIS